VSLPGTLQELFLAQLDQLPLPLRRLVQAAAVAGEPLSHGLLEAALHGDEPLTEDLLWEATRPGLLCAGPAPGQFTFGRRLLFEAAYATVPPSRRKDLHARIADHLVDQMNNTGESAVHAAAHHAYLGYHDERAIDLQIRSARQYRAQYANRQAIQTASRALELISAAPEPERFLNERLTALLLLAQSYQVVGEVDQAEAALVEAATLSDACEDQELVAQIATSAATLCWMQGNSPEAYERFSRAHDAWRRLGDETRAAQALVGMGLCANQQGQRARALESFSEAARREGVAAWVRAAALNNAGMMLLEEGRYAQAEPHLTEGLKANEEDGDRRGVAQSKCSLGELSYRLARFGEAQRWLEEALAESRDMEDAQGLVLATAYLARVHCMTGSARAAADLLSATASQPGPEFPEADAVLRAAQFEASCAADAQPPGSLDAAPAPLPEPSESDASHSGTRRNAYVETLCIAVEAALRARSGPAAADAAAALAQHVRQAPDRHLRRYGDWLLGLVERAEPIVPPLPAAEDGEQTVYDTRAQRLAQSLRPARLA
jgi:tetratricopeptide (TPR) repeat protein